MCEYLLELKFTDTFVAKLFCFQISKIPLLIDLEKFVYIDLKFFRDLILINFKPFSIFYEKLSKV